MLVGKRVKNMSFLARHLMNYWYRGRNRISAYANRIKLTLMGVHYGRNCMAQGHIYIKLSPTAYVKIGDNLHFSSGWNINALCTNKRGTIYATDKAEIIIGDNVGMSSTVL